MLRRSLRVFVGAIAVALAVSSASAVPVAQAAGDPLRSSQWSLDVIGAAASGATGAGVTVAVIDSGVDRDHEDLAGAVSGTVDCIGAAGDPDRCRTGGGDTDGHGTHVAGIIAARRGNDRGISGVAPGVNLLGVKVLDRGCEDPPFGGTVCAATGDSTDVEAGMRWAIARGARVINLSVSDDALGRATLGSPLAAAIENAWNQGVIVVVAAGNDLDVTMGSGYESVPAIVVGATAPGDTKPSYSNSVGAARWGMAAPGGADEGACPAAAIISTWLSSRPPNTDYACMDGTSMAAPHVAGAAAVLMAEGLTAEQTVTQLLSTARDIGAPGKDSVFGSGRLDLAKALATAPPVGATPPPEGGTEAVVGTASSSGTSGSARPVPSPTTTGAPATAVTSPSTPPTLAGLPAEAAVTSVPRARTDGETTAPSRVTWWLVVIALAAIAVTIAGLLRTVPLRL